jgi:hypothetical protein
MDGYATGLVTATPATGTGTTGVTGLTATTTNTGSLRYVVGDTGKNTWDQNTFNGKFVYTIDNSRSLTFGFLHDNYDYGYETGNNYLTLNGAPFIGKADVGGGKYVSVTSKSFLGLPGGRESNVYTKQLVY